MKLSIALILAVISSTAAFAPVSTARFSMGSSMSEASEEPVAVDESAPVEGSEEAAVEEAVEEPVEEGKPKKKRPAPWGSVGRGTVKGAGRK